MSKKKNLVIKSKSKSPLKIFEAADSTPSAKKYIFQGVFTACSTNDHVVVNRNNRIYGEQEVLRHLSYLRENIQTNGFILGELDHPIDRFDTQMKEASHMITDLWYDQPSHCVMGKLEVLDTPNGQIARKLIDAGYPLFVSSRAAGEVDARTKEVHIEQIFTYDIVCTPGFAEARLQKVEESLANNVKNYLNESAITIKNDRASSKKFGILDESVSVVESDVDVPALNEWQKSLMENSSLEKVSKPLLEEDEEFKLPEADINPIKTNESDDDEAKEEEKKDSSEENSDEKKDDKKDDAKEEDKLTDEELAERRAKILGIEAFSVDGENETEDDAEEKREEILDVEAKPAEDEEGTSEEPDVEEDKTDEDINVNVGSNNGSSNDVASGNQDTANGSANGNTVAPSTTLDMPMPIPASEEPKVDTKKKDDKKSDDKKDDKVLNDADKSEDIKKKTEKDMDKYKDLLDKAKKLSDVKESIVRMYPFAISLSDENFARFAALQPADKNKVYNYVMEHAIFDVQAINEQWTTPLINEKKALKNWLKLASEEYKKLYVAAPQDVQDAIEESAKYVNIQTQADADIFWLRTGLKKHDDSIIRRSLNEQYQINENATEISATSETARDLGYSMDYFKMLEDMAD
jgi:hypothetical protein